MTRSQGGQIGAASKEGKSTGQRKSRGESGRKAQPDEKVSLPAPRCWQSGAKAKAINAAHSVPTGAVPVAPNAHAQRGWGELPASERASRCAQLEEMGFTRDAAHAALEECCWDVNQALDRLFRGTDMHEPVLSASGGSTTASGVSTPRLLASTSRQDYSPPSPSSTEDFVAPSAATATPGLPPGLEDMSSFLPTPPGLEFTSDDPVPCAEISKVSGMAEQLQPSFQVPAVMWPAAAAMTGAVSVVPRRRLQKVQHSWECEEHCSNTQLSVEEGTFVYVWLDSRTETGWAYAESLICCSRAGWLPESMLEPLPPGRRWMRVSTTSRATFPTQLQIEAGNMVLVDGSRDPVEGWVYAEKVASAIGRPELQGMLGEGGWVPIQCVEWAEV